MLRPDAPPLGLVLLLGVLGAVGGGLLGQGYRAAGASLILIAVALFWFASRHARRKRR